MTAAGERSGRIHVAVDARPLSTPVSGVARVISRILKYFPRPDRFHFYLYSHNPPHPDFVETVALDWVTWVGGRGMAARRGGVWFNLVLPRILADDRIDIFWGSQQVIPPGLPVGLPVVLTYYDLVLYFFPAAMRTLARWQQRAVQSYSVRRADRILTISAQTRTDLIRKFHYPPEKAAVALLGFEGIDEPGRDRSSFPADEQLTSDLARRLSTGPFFLAVSTLEPRKNYSVLLEGYAAYHHRETERPYPLVIAGRRGWESPSFFRRLEEIMGQTGDIIWFNRAGDDLIDWLYARCACFCFPTLYEGFGLPLLEARCREKFALVSDLPCLHEIGGESILYLPPHDAQAWGRALLESAAAHRAGKLRQVPFPVSEWSWERTARIHCEAFAAVLGAS